MGIAHQIVSSLYTYRVDNLGTVNDCKVVVNHLIRKFSEPLTKEGLQKQYKSTLLKEGDKVIKEHLIPVKEIMETLLELNLDEPKFELAEQIHQFLTEALVIVRVSEAEDAILNKQGFQQKMPASYRDSNSVLHNDIWARYKSAGIYGNICLSVGD